MVIIRAHSFPRQILPNSALTVNGKINHSLNQSWRFLILMWSIISVTEWYQWLSLLSDMWYWYHIKIWNFQLWFHWLAECMSSTSSLLCSSSQSHTSHCAWVMSYDLWIHQSVSCRRQNSTLLNYHLINPDVLD